MLRKENQLDATECFIAPDDGHKSARNMLSRLEVRSWWWAYKCPKHVEQIISALLMMGI